MNAPQKYPPGVTSEQIALRAYEIYCDAGRPDGHDTEHWAQAESQLRTEKQNSVEQSVIIPALLRSA
jgi:hypothetical protein